MMKSSAAQAVTLPGGQSTGDTGYLAGLDGLRAIAALAVMYAHSIHNPWAIPDAPEKLGNWSVMTFFVLSGFVVTRSLMRSKEKKESLSSFYLARMARLLPIYILAILVVGLWKGFGHWVYASCWTLTTNFQADAMGVPGFPLGHFWSLCVEWHFYLAWPLVLYALPRKALPWVCVTTIGAATFYSVLASHQLIAAGADAEQVHHHVYTHTFSQAAPLAVGSLAALWEGLLRNHPMRMLSLACASIVAGSLVQLILPLVPAMRLHPTNWLPLLDHLRLHCWSIAAFLIALYSSYGYGSKMVHGFLHDSIMQEVGKISYGIYVWHALVFNWFRGQNYHVADKGLFFVGAYAMTFGVAMVSYYAFEEPIRQWARSRIGAGRTQKEVLRAEMIEPVRIAA